MIYKHEFDRNETIVKSPHPGAMVAPTYSWDLGGVRGFQMTGA